MVTVLRPLSTSELLDRTFHLYRNNFLVFVGIAAIPQLAVLALQLGSAAMLFSGSVVGFSAVAIVAGLVSFIAIEVSQAATVMAVSHLHLDRPTTIGTAFSAAKPSLGRVIGISLGVGIAVGIGFLLLIIPASIWPWHGPSPFRSQCLRAEAWAPAPPAARCSPRAASAEFS